MKKKLTTLLLSVAACLGMYAQGESTDPFPPKDEDGQTIYYRIWSAFPDYADRALCLQDNTAQKTGFNYILTPADGNAKNQEWVLTAIDVEKGSYLLRSRSSYRYISTAYTWTDEWMVQSFASKKQTTDAFSIGFLDDRQVTISFEGSGGSGRCYLCASDISKAKQEMPGVLKSTVWAWTILPSTELPEGIGMLDADESVCETYDLQGRRLPADEPLPSGIYIRKTASRTYKIRIR